MNTPPRAHVPRCLSPPVTTGDRKTQANRGLSPVTAVTAIMCFYARVCAHLCFLVTHSDTVTSGGLPGLSCHRHEYSR